MPQITVNIANNKAVADVKSVNTEIKYLDLDKYMARGEKMFNFDAQE